MSEAKFGDFVNNAEVSVAGCGIAGPADWGQ